MKNSKVIISVLAILCTLVMFGTFVYAGSYTNTISYSLSNADPWQPGTKSYANTAITSVSGQSGVSRTYTVKAWIKNTAGDWIKASCVTSTTNLSNLGAFITATSNSEYPKTSYHYYDMNDGQYSTGGEVTYYSPTSTTGSMNVG